MAAYPLAIVLVASVSLLVYWTNTTLWPRAVFTTLFNLVWWAGLYYLYVRQARKRKRALEKRGIFVYIRYPGSRPGSLQDRWAGGTAACHPHQVMFQEVMSGTDVSLGKPATFDAVSLVGPPRKVTGGMPSHLSPGLRVLTLALAQGTVEIAAEPSALATLEQEVFRDDPTA